MSIYSVSPQIIVDCVVMAGQSNEAGGIGMGAPSLIYSSSQPYTWIFDKNNDRSSTDNGRVQNLLYGYNQNWDSVHYITNGPEISCGYNYYLSSSKPLLIIKYAQGSSGLVDDGVTTNLNGLWQIDADSTRANNLLHYTILTQYFVIPCIQHLKGKNINVNIKGFHWCQGETDSQNITQSNNYQNQLTRLFNQFTNDLTPYNVISPNFKFIVTRTNINTTGSTHISTIRTAQENVVTNFNGYLIDSDLYPLTGSLHYTNIGQETHGIDVCSKLMLIP